MTMPGALRALGTIGALAAGTAVALGAFGAVAPIGGVLLILGWPQWAWHARPARKG